MSDFVQNVLETLLQNSENITIGVIFLVVVLVLGAIVFAFVHIALKLSARNSQERTEERSADNAVIERLFNMIDRFEGLTKILESQQQYFDNSLILQSKMIDSLDRQLFVLDHVKELPHD